MIDWILGNLWGDIREGEPQGACIVIAHASPCP